MRVLASSPPGCLSELSRNQFSSPAPFPRRSPSTGPIATTRLIGRSHVISSLAGNASGQK
eukprot:8122691-Pyramimonas_sp.AAC.1